jgi:ribose 5-phosphate isomerase B
MKTLLKSNLAGGELQKNCRQMVSQFQVDAINFVESSWSRSCGILMRIAVAADHAGVPLNEAVIAELRRLGHEVIDLGGHDPSQPDDYPDFAAALAREILAGRAERGILICGSGVGASVAANKINGIRAGLAHDTYSAHQGVEHDNMNVLCLGSRVIGVELALELVRTFVAAKFSGEERHQRRLAKIDELERKGSPN